MGRVLAVANQKGGVGKTTTAVNLSASLAFSGHPTLLVDCDPQANSTASLGFPRDPSRRTLYHALTFGEPLGRLKLHTGVERLELVPSEKNLVGATVELVQAEDREFRLRRALEALRHEYSYLVLDCPPALDLLTLNALCAADSVLVPIQCEYLALEGVTELLDTLMRIRRSLNPGLAIEGILLTMYDERTNLSRQVVADLRDFFGAQVFAAVIPRNVRLAEAPSHGQPILLYDPHSRGCQSYLELAKEVIAHDSQSAGQGAERAAS
ncbi:MAG: ParA family protein [Terriglobales bacterium]